MNDDRGGSSDLPIACTLPPGDLAAMRDELLPGLLARATAKEPVPGGFRWRFDSDEGLLNEAAAVIDAERRCCRFLRFVLCVEAGGEQVWLEVTGPPGTEEFLAGLRDAPGGSEDA